MIRQWLRRLILWALDGKPPRVWHAGAVAGHHEPVTSSTVPLSAPSEATAAASLSGPSIATALLTVETELQRLQDDHDALQANFDDLDIPDLEDVEKRLDEAEQSIAKAEENIETLDGRCDELEGDVKELTDDKADGDEVDGLESRISDLEGAQE